MSEERILSLDYRGVNIGDGNLRVFQYQALECQVTAPFSDIQRQCRTPTSA